MKYAAIVMALLVIAGAVLGIYTAANARIQIESVSLAAASGEEKQTEFAKLQQAMDNGALIGTPFTETLTGNSSDYSFFTYTFRLKNGGLIDAEMVEIQPVPTNGDVLCYTSLDSSQAAAELTVKAGKERDAWCVVLTSRQNQEQHLVTRSFRITYYIWGVAKSTVVTYN
ncbi:MAG: hypothetical protein II481_04135 [Clostridia bacterium]|jgi:hypothetical protein|nr:hypothetical protein [Clostridia bacterium]